jgi:amidase
VTDSELARLDAVATAALIARGDLSPTEAVDAAIARIDAVDGEIGAVIHRLDDRARAAAAAGPRGPFAGVPVVIKDLDGELAGAPLHLGNRLLRELGYTASVTSHLFAKLEAAGFVIVGKTNTPEFGLQPTTEPHAVGPTRNPWDTARSPGGSSGGSGAAVAAGMVPVAHAGDGGGSIRIPASECGLVGLKPSRGRVSLGPVEGESWNGFVVRHVVTRTVRDSAAVLDVLAGEMPGDPYTAPPPGRPFADEVGTDPRPLRIGLHLRPLAGICEVDPECAAAAESAARTLEGLGHAVEVAGPAALDEAEVVASFLTIVAANARASVEDLERRAGRPVTADDVEPGTWALAENGREVGAVALLQTVAAAHAWSRRVLSWWHDDGFDVLLTPTLAAPARELGRLNPVDGDPALATVLQTPYVAFAAPSNVTGQPAISLPLGTSAGGLPLGVQLVGAAHREDLLLALAGQLERAVPWAERRPAVYAD